MPVESGTHLGRYEIRSKLGEGGMGVVYRAFDPKIGREVAIKVLPSEYSADAGRLARFEREAQAAGSLSHENVLTVYDTGTHDGAPYIVSELLEGEDLRAQLERGPLPLRRALDYARQIAAGLAAAHARDIVHRDLKPENVFVTAEGRVKILDFGIAKLVEAAPADGYQTSAETRRLGTAPGSVIGTAAYMSPEQAAGAKLDHRSDIFSFGCVLYEMLTSRRAFERGNWIDTLSAIRNEEPPELASAEGQPAAPAAVERIVMRCLEKRPERRFQSAGDLAFALETLSGSGTASRTVTAAVESPPARAPRWRARLPWLVAGLALLLAAVALMLPYLRRAPVEAAQVRFAVPLPEGASFSWDVETNNLSLSPDGRRLAFVAVTDGQRRLWVRPLDSLSAQPLAGTEGAYSPFWSPDGRHIAFFADGKLKRIEATGAAPQTVCALSGEVDTSGSWGRDGTIIFWDRTRPSAAGPLVIDEGTIFRVPSSGGTPEPLPRDPKVDYFWVRFLPDGRRYLAYGYSEQDRSVNGIYVASLDAAEARRLVQVNFTRVAYASGHLIYAREGSLVAQPFDAAALRTTGEPFTVADPVPHFDKTGWVEFAVSEAGALAYMTELPKTRLVWLDRTGREAGQVGEPGLYTNQLRLSPDGQRLALSLADARTLSGDLLIHDLVRGARTRFAYGPADDGEPVWSPDGRRLAYFSCCEGKSSLYVKGAGDSGKGDAPLEPGFQTPTDWSPDGRFILFTQNQPTTLPDLWVLPVSEGGKPYPLFETPFGESGGRFSPDGRFVAYSSNESGRHEIYVARFDRPAEKSHVSTGGGTQPRWRGDGRELFFVSADQQLMSVATEPGEDFKAGTPAPLFRINADGYDVARDGQRFLVNVGGGAQAAPFAVILNWAADPKR